MKRGAHLLVLLLSWATAPAIAHHSEAGFDIESVVAFRGMVTAFTWRNPHVYIKVAADSESGERLEWEVETGATPLLARSGWTRDSLRAGEQVLVRGHPAREPGRRYALLISVEKSDGTVLQQRVTNSESTAVASDISGIWKGNFADLEFLAQGFESIPPTPRGAAARAAYDVNTENPAARCIAYSTPAIIVASGFFLTKVDIADDVITLRNEWFDAERTVYMDGRGHPDGGERTVQGHSIGWWEADTLVIDTTQFADHRSPYQTGVPSGARKHVVERYTLSGDGRRLTVDFALEDPEFLAEPFSGSIDWSYRPDLEFFQFACDPAVSSQYVPR